MSGKRFQIPEKAAGVTCKKSPQAVRRQRNRNAMRNPVEVANQSVNGESAPAARFSRSVGTRPNGKILAWNQP